MRSTTGLKIRSRAAFTLLELILVMAIIGITIAMAIPSLHGFAQGRRPGECAEQIVSLANWARTQAIARGLVYRLNVNPASRTYWLTVEQDDGTVSALGEEFGRVFTAPDGVTLSWDVAPQPDGQYVRFTPTGRCDPGNIYITDGHGQPVQISCYTPSEMYHVVTAQERQQG